MSYRLYTNFFRWKIFGFIFLFSIVIHFSVCRSLCNVKICFGFDTVDASTTVSLSRNRIRSKSVSRDITIHDYNSQSLNNPP